MSGCMHARREGGMKVEVVVQVGDWGRDGTQNQSAVASLMATVADAVNPDFILSMGDNFYESKPFPM